MVRGSAHLSSTPGLPHALLEAIALGRRRKCRIKPAMARTKTRRSASGLPARTLLLTLLARDRLQSVASLAPKTCSFKRFSNVRNTRCSNSFSLDSKSRLDLAKTYINSKRFLNFTRFMSHIFFIRLTRVPSTLIVFHPSRHTCTHEPRTHTRFHAHTLSRTHTLACTHTPAARKHASMRGG